MRREVEDEYQKSSEMLYVAALLIGIPVVVVITVAAAIAVTIAYLLR